MHLLTMNDRDVDKWHGIYEPLPTQLFIPCDMSANTARCSFDLYSFYRSSLQTDSPKHLRSYTACCSLERSGKRVLNGLTSLTQTMIFKNPELSERLVNQKAKSKRQLNAYETTTRPTFTVLRGNNNMEIDNKLKTKKLNELFKTDNLLDPILVFSTC